MCFEFLGACCATCACQACTACVPSGKGSKVPYMLILFLSTIVAMCLRYWGGDLVEDIQIESLGLCVTTTCYGFEAVYRISFALALFYLTMAFLLSCRGCRAVDGGHWCLKALYFVLLVGGVWFLPDSFYDGYVQVARIVSGFFLIFQIMLLIACAYDWNDAWLAQDMKKSIVGASVFLYAICIVGLVLLFKYFAGEECERNQTFISITLIITFLFSMLSLTETIKHGALLPSAVVSTYCYWVTFSAMQSDPDPICNSLIDTDEDNTWFLIIGLIWAAISICYAAWNLAADKTLMGQERDEEEQRLADAPLTSPEVSVGGGDSGIGESHEYEELRAKHDEDEEQEIAMSDTRASQNIKFHVVMASSAMYMAMLLTSWGSRAEADNTSESYDLSLESMWIKIISEWIAALLYTWTLVAPYVLSDRDFGYD